jgi:hypothetical protein
MSLMLYAPAGVERTMKVQEVLLQAPATTENARRKLVRQSSGS